MFRLKNNCVGIDQGDVEIFSDFQDNGEMWTGSGPRERRKAVTFAEAFLAVPVVQVSISLWDVDGATSVRADISAETVTPQGFELVFKTWADTRVARLRASWMAIGALNDDDSWDVL